MITKADRNKLVRTTRTFRFRIVTTNLISQKFKQAQQVQRLYFNYGLKYLYQHYGVSHLASYLPKGTKRNYLINRMVEFARQKAKTHDFNLKEMDYNVQSVDKTLASLCVNFERYRNGQYKRIYRWSEKEKQRYLVNHNCQLTGYGRISYKHSLDDVKSVTFKQNHNCIRLINNFCLHLPFFSSIQVSESLSSFKRKKIVEARLVKRHDNDFELQIIIRFGEQRNVTKEQVKQAVGLDVNLKDNQFFALSNKKVIIWDQDTACYYRQADRKSRKLQHYITTHNHGNDGSLQTRKVKRQLAKLKAKTTNKIDSWQLQVAKQLAQNYPVLVMEQLDVFTMRISKRDKAYQRRKNTNHKLAMLHPTKFRQQMETTYQNNHCLLIEVNSFDTSKTCHYCGFINHALTVGKKQWECPQCHRELNRDLNATYNIRDWGLDPRKHAVMKQPKRFPNRKANTLIELF